jgi:Cu/Ag efflux pump CusA
VKRESTMHVVFLATKEIQGSIVFATLIIMLVFVPLFFLSGIEGRLMVPLGLAYVISLFASLLVSITVTPVLASMFLGRPRKSTSTANRASWSGCARPTAACSMPRWSAGRPSPPPAAPAGRRCSALGAAGQSFLPDFNEGTLTVGVETLPGTALAESARLGQLVEEVLLSHPEVVATARRTGRSPLDPHALDVHQSEIEVSLKMTTGNNARSKEDFLAALRADFAKLPGVQVVVGQPISHRIDHMLSGSARQHRGENLRQRPGRVAQAGANRSRPSWKRSRARSMSSPNSRPRFPSSPSSTGARRWRSTGCRRGAVGKHRGGLQRPGGGQGGAGTGQL